MHVFRAERIRTLGALVIVVFFLLGTGHVFSKSVALLVGIADYAGTTRSLYGPVNDVNALAERLTKHWGFTDGDIVRLVDGKATRAAILQELAALEARTVPGDSVLIYFSGHGVSMFASEESGARNSYMPDSSGGAFVAVDSMVRFNQSRQAQQLYLDLVVGRRDIRPVVESLDRNGRFVTLIADACYSGQLLRNSGRLLESRQLPTFGEAARDLLRDLAARSSSDDRSQRDIYRNAHILTSAGAGEIAADIPARALSVYPTVDGKPHGAMTDALLRVLDGSLPADIDRDGTLSFAEVHRVVAEFMDGRRYGHTPQRIPSVAEAASAGGAFLNLKSTLATAPARWSAARPLRLRIVGDAKAHAASLLTLPNVNEVTDQAAADLTLLLHRGALHLTNRSEASVASAALDRIQALRAVVLQEAFAERIHALSNNSQRAMLEFEIDPHVFGGNMVIGQKIALVVKPDRAASLLVVTIDAEAKVSVLYPQSARERMPLSAGQRRYIPGEGERERIEVSPPVGTDYLFAFAFDEPPSQYELISSIEKVPATDPRVSRITQAIEAARGKFTYGRAVLRTFPKPVASKN